MLPKRRGRQIRLTIQLIFSSLILILAGRNFEINKITAQELGPDSKDAALEELHAISENQAVYESQISALLKKSLAIENQYQLIQKRLQKTQNAAEKAGKDILAGKILAENMRLERKKLISELYIVTNDPLYFVLSFINTDQFMAKMHGKDENSIVVNEKIKKVIEINSLLNSLSDRQRTLSIKKKAYGEEAQKLARKAGQLQIQIAAREGSLGALSGRKSALERYLTGLSALSSNLKRDFVSWNLSAGPYFEFIGGGTEHGLGLSQYGAKGMAKAGKDYRQILAHYYQRAQIKKLDDIYCSSLPALSMPEGSRTQTSRLANARSKNNCDNPYVRIGVVLGGTGGELTVAAGTYQIHGFTLDTGNKIIVSPKDIRIYHDDALIKKFANDGTERILPGSNQSLMQVNYKSSYFNQYFGELRLVKTGSSLATINVLRLEEYLKGVVPAEMPASWPEEAIKAQTLAARSYALRHLKSGGLYDMDDSTNFQVYLGAAQRARSNIAIKETRGEVITYADKIINAFYFSTSGGFTENNENIWGGKAVPYLRGVESPWEEDSPWWTWYSKRYSRTEMTRLLSSLLCGKIKKIQITARGISGRVLAIKIIGENGIRVISGAHFKDLINASLGPEDLMMRSTLFGVK